MARSWGERCCSCGGRPRRPRRSGSKSQVASGNRRLMRGILHEQPELPGREAAEHGHDAVVTAHRMELQRIRGEPDAGGREPAAANVAHDHARARDAIELSQHHHRIGSLEVVERLRADGDVDTLRCDRERERIRANRNEPARACLAERRCARVDAERSDAHAARAPRRRRERWDVADPGAHVEERHALLRIRAEHEGELLPHRAPAAEHRVRARDIGERACAQCVVDAGIVQYLVAALARRCEKGRHAPLSAPARRIHRDNRAEGFLRWLRTRRPRR